MSEDESQEIESGKSEECSTGFSVAFWNLQNLFDIESSRLATDLEFTPIHGWDRRALEAKIRGLAETIRNMFGGRGPDLLGICEVENDRVARLLMEAVGRTDYALATSDDSGLSGLDTALIYSTETFEIDNQRTAGHVVHLQHLTRDIFEVHLKVKSNDAALVVLVNHWPSQGGGQALSEAFRMAVASHCRELVSRNVKFSRREYLKLKDDTSSLQTLNDAWNTNVLLMGDFNDEPWSRSVMDVLGAGFTTQPMQAIEQTNGSLPSFRAYASARVPLFNPMWSLMSEPDVGTRCGGDATHVMQLHDQFVLSQGLYTGRQGLQVRRQRRDVPDVQIYRPENIRASSGKPQPFVTECRTGFSDHFPITTEIEIIPRSFSNPAV